MMKMTMTVKMGRVGVGGKVVGGKTTALEAGGTVDSFVNMKQGRLTRVDYCAGEREIAVG
jgi:hypothetical protein